MNAERKIMQARTNLILDAPFFGALALRLHLVADPTCETFYTDGHRLGYNPQYVDSLTISECQAVICHEVLHCSNGHPWRKGGREHQRWNLACDAAINPIVEASGMKLPAGAFTDVSFDGMAAEMIYSHLPENPKGGGQGQGEGGCGCGEVREAQEADPASEGEWQVATLQAAQAAKAMGKLPAGLERLLDKIKHPSVDWKAALRRFVQQAAKADYSWARPNRRFIASGLYLPEMRSESMPPVVCVVDTSGSIGQAELDQFASEITSVLDEVKPEKLTVIYCDAKVQDTEDYAPGETITLTAKGGGGTDFRPPFEWVSEREVNPACLIYLTDMYGTFPVDAPDYPVLWAATSEIKAQFGETLKVDFAHV